MEAFEAMIPIDFGKGQTLVPTLGTEERWFPSYIRLIHSLDLKPTWTLDDHCSLLQTQTSSSSPVYWVSDLVTVLDQVNKTLGVDTWLLI